MFCSDIHTQFGSSSGKSSTATPTKMLSAVLPKVKWSWEVALVGRAGLRNVENHLSLAWLLLGTIEQVESPDSWIEPWHFELSNRKPKNENILEKVLAYKKMRKYIK